MPCACRVDWPASTPGEGQDRMGAAQSQTTISTNQRLLCQAHLDQAPEPSQQPRGAFSRSSRFRLQRALASLLILVLLSICMSLQVDPELWVRVGRKVLGQVVGDGRVEDRGNDHEDICGSALRA